MNNDVSVTVLAFAWNDKLRDALRSTAMACEIAGITQMRIWVNAGAKNATNTNEIKSELGADAVRWHFDSPPAGERVPVYANWNQALASSSTKYVHLMHDDDTVSAYFYLEQIRMIKSEPNAALFAVSALFNCDGRVYPIKHDSKVHLAGTLAERLTHKNLFLSPEIVINRDRFVPFPDGYTYCGDWRCWYLNSVESAVVTSKELLFNYNMASGNTSSSKDVVQRRFREMAYAEDENCRDESARRQVHIIPTREQATSTSRFFAVRAMASRKVRLAMLEATPLLRSRHWFGVIRELTRAFFFGIR